MIKLNVETTYKNTTNRHRMEMLRLRSLVKRGHITRSEAVEMFQKYLEHQLGRRAVIEFPYKQVA